MAHTTHGMALAEDTKVGNVKAGLATAAVVLVTLAVLKFGSKVSVVNSARSWLLS